MLVSSAVDRGLSNWAVFLDTGLDVMLCLRTEWITKYLDGLLEMLFVKRKIGVSELWQNLENAI